MHFTVLALLITRIVGLAEFVAASALFTAKLALITTTTPRCFAAFLMTVTLLMHQSAGNTNILRRTSQYTMDMIGQRKDNFKYVYCILQISKRSTCRSAADRHMHVCARPRGDGARCRVPGHVTETQKLAEKYSKTAGESWPAGSHEKNMRKQTDSCSIRRVKLASRSCDENKADCHEYHTYHSKYCSKSLSGSTEATVVNKASKSARREGGVRRSRKKNSR